MAAGELWISQQGTLSWKDANNTTRTATGITNNQVSMVDGELAYSANALYFKPPGLSAQEVSMQQWQGTPSGAPAIDGAIFINGSYLMLYFNGNYYAV